jgi:sialidase-1
MAVLTPIRQEPRSLRSRAAVIGCWLALATATPASAEPVEFTGSGTRSWASAGNWSTGGLPGAGDLALFSAVDGDATINLDGNHSVAGMRFTNSWTTLLRAGGTRNQTLTIGGEGIRIEPGAGPVIIGVDSSNQRVPITVSASHAWANHSANRLVKMAGGGSTQIGSHTLTFDGSGEIEILSATEGSGGRLVKDGAGTLILTRGNASVTGGFTLNACTVVAGHNSALTSGPLLVTGGALAAREGGLTLSNAVTVAGDTGLSGFHDLTLAGPVTLAGDHTVSVSGYKEILNAGEDTQRFVPVMLTLAGRVADGGAGHGITKDGPATLVLSGANTYGGATTVTAGTLAINGNQAAASGPVTAGSRATLAGTGRVGGPVTVHGALTPGHAGTGNLSLEGGLTLAAASILRVRVDDDGASRLDVAGTLKIEPDAVLEIDGRGYRGDSNSLLLVAAGDIIGGFERARRHVDFPPNYAATPRQAGGQLHLDIVRAGEPVEPAPPAVAPVLVAQLAGEELKLSCRSRVGQRYQLQHSVDLAGWSGIGEPVDGTCTNLEFAGQGGGQPDATSFYRALESGIPRVSKSDLFREGEHGIVSYRIPGIVVTASGTVLAYCEARVYSGADLGEIEIHMRRSTDGGRTFSEPVQIAHMGPRLPRNPVLPPSKQGGYFGEPDEQTVNNPMAIATADGTVHFIYCVEYYRAFHMRSDDDGLTWSEPIEITHVFDEFRADCDWQYLATGPGHGVELGNGRLLVPIRVSDFRPAANDPGFISTIFSDDGGQTWRPGGIALRPASEAMLTERADGSVFLTARNPRTRKANTTSPDGVTGWTPVHYPEELLEPGCMAGLATHPGTPEHPGPFLILSNPHTTLRENKYRKDVSLKVSWDGGRTWPVHRVLEHGPSAYSDLAVLPDGTVLCFYESGHPDVVVAGRDWPYAVVRLAHIPLEWLLGDE